MKNLLKFSIFSFVIILGLIISSNSFAEDRVVPNEVIKGLSIGVFNTKIISQDENKFNISFEIGNGEGPQAGLRYTLKLLKETKEGQFLVDSYTSRESFSIDANSTTPKEFTYTAPSNISGKYKIFIFLSRESGQNLGLGFAGEVNLTSSSSVFEIIPESCFLSVVGEKIDRKYNLTQGVDISSSEELSLSCSVLNSSKDSINITPVYETHFRTISGDIVPHEGGDTNSVSLGAEENKIISLVLPKALSPQAYDVKVSLKQGDIVSNSVVVHYVIQGASATILRASLDKDYYEKGQTANVILSWAPSADSFLDSRSGKGTDLSNIVLSTKITNSSGLNCIKPIDSNLEEISSSHKADIPVTIKSKCKNPTLFLQIKDENGKILDEKKFSFESTNIPESKGLDIKTIIFIILGVVVLVGVVVYIINLNKKSNETINQNEKNTQ